MKLFVGLGNPGKEYELTRHNIGARFIDFIAEKQGLSFKENFKSLFAEFNLNGEKMILLKPQTFMNNSGQAVAEIVKFYKIPLENIYIAFDDLDIVEGEWKIQFSKYPKVHNGINDVIEKLSSDKINFVRIGVDGRSKIERDFISGADYVLQKTSFDFKNVFENIWNYLNVQV